MGEMAKAIQLINLDNTIDCQFLSVIIVCVFIRKANGDEFILRNHSVQFDEGQVVDPNTVVVLCCRSLRGVEISLWVIPIVTDINFSPITKSMSTFICMKNLTKCTRVKSCRRGKSALNVLNSPSLKESPCPNHPSYILGSFTQLDIYVWATCTRIFNFLGPFLGA